MADKVKTLYIDTSKSPRVALVRSLNTNAPAKMDSLTFGDYIPFELYFVNAGELDDISGDSNYTVRVAVGDLGSSPLAMSTAWGTGTDCFTGSLNLATNNLSASLIGLDSITTNFEVELFYAPQGNRRTYLQVPVTIWNECISSSIAPISASQYYTSIESDARFSLKGDIGGGWQTGSGGATLSWTDNDVAVGLSTITDAKVVFVDTDPSILSLENKTSGTAIQRFVNSSKYKSFAGIGDNGSYNIGFTSESINTNPVICFTSGSTPRVGIGTTSPSFPVDQRSTTTATSGGPYNFYILQTVANDTASTSYPRALCVATNYSSSVANTQTGVYYGVNAGYFNCNSQNYGVVSQQAALVASAQCAYTGRILSQQGLRVYMESYATSSATASISNSYGIYMESSHAGNVTNRYGIYQATANDSNYFAGNTGIGTTTPAQKLHVNGYIQGTRFTTGTTAGSTYGVNTDAAVFITGSAGGVILADRATSGSNYWWTLFANTGSFGLYCNSAERFWVGRSGGVTCSFLQVKNTPSIIHTTPYLAYYRNEGARLGYVGFASSTVPYMMYFGADSASAAGTGFNWRVGGVDVMTWTSSVFGLNNTSPYTYADRMFIYSPTVCPTLPVLYVYQYSTLTASSGGTYQSIRGITQVNGDFTVTGSIVGIQGQGVFAGNAATSSNIYGGLYYTRNVGTSLVNNQYGVYIRNQNEHSSGKVTNAYGFYVDSTLATGTVTNPYGFYQAGTSDKNYFAGTTGIGSSATTAKLNVSGSTGIAGYFDGKVGIGTNTITSALCVLGASTTAYGSLQLSDGASPTTYINGVMWNSTTRPTVAFAKDSLPHDIVGCIHANTATVTRNGATETEQSLMSATLTLPANFLTQYKVLRVKAYGYHSIVNTGLSCNYRLNLGTTTIVSTGNIQFNDATSNKPWYFEGLISVRSAGSSGTVVGDGKLEYVYASTGSVVKHITSAGVVTIDTEDTQSLALTMDYSDGDCGADDKVECQQLIVEVL